MNEHVFTSSIFLSEIINNIQSAINLIKVPSTSAGQNAMIHKLMKTPRVRSLMSVLVSILIL